MNFKKITIIGVGLIGSSLALALRKKGYKGTITGLGRSEDTLKLAKELEIIDDYSTVHAEGVKDADLVVLASSVALFEQIIVNIRDHLKEGAIVTDVGSVKGAVLRTLTPLMPEGVRFVAGHPIAGRECSGVKCATDDLFENAKCIITPDAATDKDALGQVKELWDLTGARTIIMPAEEHDLTFAAVSHLPHVVAYSLINSILDINGEILRYGGGGLRDFTRIALSSPSMWRDICAHNRNDVLKTLKTFSSSLSRMISFVEESNWEGLEKEFTRAQEARKLIESD
jgi:prephenate dehydrogenase